MMIQQKKGATVRDTFIVILIGIFAITAMFYFISDRAVNAGITIRESDQEAFNELREKQTELDDTSKSIRGILGDDVDETKGDEPGYFGLRGILNAMKAPIVILNTATSSLKLTFGMLDFIPGWILTTITVGITILIVFALVAYFTNRGKEP